VLDNDLLDCCVLVRAGTDVDHRSVIVCVSRLLDATMISVDMKRRITIKCKKIIRKIRWTAIWRQYRRLLISSDILTTYLFFVHSLFEKTLKYESRTKYWSKLEHFIFACRSKEQQKISNNVLCAKILFVFLS